MTKVTVTKESTLKIANDSEVIEVVLPKGEYAISDDTDSTSLILNTEFTEEDLDFCGTEDVAFLEGKQVRVLVDNQDVSVGNIKELTSVTVFEIHDGDKVIGYSLASF